MNAWGSSRKPCRSSWITQEPALIEPSRQLFECFLACCVRVLKGAESLQFGPLPHHTHEIISCSPAIFVECGHTAAHRDPPTLG
jgi:hypothetical protein